MRKPVEFKNRDRFIELGLTIAAVRKMRGLTQEQLTDKADVSRSHISSIEVPNTVYPFSLEILFKIPDAADVRPGDMLNTSLPGSRPKE